MDSSSPPELPRPPLPSVGETTTIMIPFGIILFGLLFFVFLSLAFFSDNVGADFFVTEFIASFSMGVMDRSPLWFPAHLTAIGCLWIILRGLKTTDWTERITIPIYAFLFGAMGLLFLLVLFIGFPPPPPVAPAYGFIQPVVVLSLISLASGVFTMAWMSTRKQWPVLLLPIVVAVGISAYVIGVMTPNLVADMGIDMNFNQKFSVPILVFIGISAGFVFCTRRYQAVGFDWKTAGLIIGITAIACVHCILFIYIMPFHPMTIHTMGDEPFSVALAMIPSVVFNVIFIAIEIVLWRKIRSNRHLLFGSGYPKKPAA